ncbi:MAG: glycyl-radical enzyme activating protein [Bacteroidales bacterium]|nr:glycyl-radical enzyme activating protein [Bacteroidales bacterium]MCF8457595.1 glycyl-radical enzyme activating protein [Bacteroidales bacterium]
MKGTIFDIKRFAVHDGPGIRTTVFLKGCPLQCWWCHNPEGISPQLEKFQKEITLDGKVFKTEEIIGREISVDALMEEIIKDKVFFEESGGGVTFSGGEPLMQAGFLLQVLKKCKAENLHTVVDTSGYGKQEDLKAILPYTDLFLFDLKLMDPTAHKNFTGVDNQQILANLDFLIQQKAQVIVRFPVVPRINDTKENLSAMKKFISARKELKEIHLLPFHNMAKSKYERFGLHDNFQDIELITHFDIEAISEYFMKEVLQVKIGG